MLARALVLLSTISAVASDFVLPGVGSKFTWQIDHVQQIRYKTNFVAYTIALWQQSLTQASASEGPIIFETSNGPETELEWLVQTYDFDLNTSNVFFLWLFEGASSAQGNQSAPNKLSSAYFNITSASAPKSASTTSTLDAPTSKTSTLSTSSQASGTTTSGGSGPTGSPGGISSSSGGLSIGAQAGIGASTGTACLGIIAAVLLFLRYRSKKQKELQALRERSTYIYSADGKRAWKEVPLPPPLELPCAELSSHRETDLVELE